MSEQSFLPLPFELRDVSGKVVGVIVPKQALTELLGNGPPRGQPVGEALEHHLEIIRQLQGERDCLREEVAALQRSLASLAEQEAKTAAALQEVTEERDIYHQSLLKMLPTQRLSDAEWADLIKNRIPLEGALKELGIDLSQED